MVVSEGVKPTRTPRGTGVETGGHNDRMGEEGVIYLLHFDRPVAEGHTTQHYLGWARKVGARVAHHRKGTGARLTQVAVERGIGMEVVREWAGTRDDERRLKNRKEGPALCPVCAYEQGRRLKPVNGLRELEV